MRATIAPLRISSYVNLVVVHRLQEVWKVCKGQITRKSSERSFFLEMRGKLYSEYLNISSAYTVRVQ